MKIFLSFIIFLPRMLFAQLEIVAVKETPLVFAGKSQTIQINFKNPAEKTIASEVRTRLYQASSTTLMPIGESQAWKQLQVLPGQTIIENITVDFPIVRTVTEFRLRFSADNKQVADLKIQVVPDDLLKQLSAMAGKTPVGIFDPDNQLKPLLEKNKIEFHDLENGAGFDDFHGKLVFIGPFNSKDSIPENLQKRVAAKREKPLAIVWIQPPETIFNPLLPVYVARESENVIVIVQNGVIANLAELPKSQLNLIRAAQLALRPESLQFPENKTP